MTRLLSCCFENKSTQSCHVNPNLLAVNKSTTPLLRKWIVPQNQVEHYPRSQQELSSVKLKCMSAEQEQSQVKR